MTPATLIRDSRKSAGLTQQQLADRLGVDQSVVARLERGKSSPTVGTMERVLRAAGFELELAARPVKPSLDESLIRQQLELSPGERVASLERMYAEARAIALAGARARGELA
jgi:transcriptional regulator with XRE-family HTH domain